MLYEIFFEIHCFIYRIYVHIRKHILWFKEAYQRTRRGWSDYDTYDLDEYLVRVIADSLEYFAENTTSCPAHSDPHMWEQHLLSIADDIRSYLTDGKIVFEPEDESEDAFELGDEPDLVRFKHGMRSLTEVFSSLWE